MCADLSIVIPGRRHSASKTRVNALLAPDPESRAANTEFMVLDSGFAPSVRPGMTG
jgi:hypothetical protein